MKKVLYIGSGNSALLIKNIDFSNYITISVNNAWRVFEDKCFNYWVHSGDFPCENHPKVKNFHTEISYKQYEPAIKKLAKTLEIKEDTAVFDIGYTIFFQGLYWIFEEIKPNEIYTLGFDHDYNPEKTKKWVEQGKPTPQNGFKKDKEESIEKWSNRVYGEFKPDFFYGHGTPDPLRLGEHHLKEKFKFAIKNSEKLGIKLYNASPVKSEINSWEKKLLV
jgi:hypothetical protein